jgi:hypothetical protein
LVTVTIGGNDVGYVPLLSAACLPWPSQWIPFLGSRIRDLRDWPARDRALDDVAGSLREVGEAVRLRAPKAKVLFVDYLTILPPAGQRAFPLSSSDAELARHIALRLESLTAEAATDTGCELVRAGEASREHHAWSNEPWTVGCALPMPGRAMPMHPNAAGMRAVARLIASHVTTGLSEWAP